MARKIFYLPIMLLCIPFVYLTLYLDVYYHSVAGFFLTLILALLTGVYFKGINRLGWWFLGNVVSTLLSILLYKGHSDWDYVYQPYSPITLILMLAVIYLIPQIIGIIWAKFLHIHFK